MANVDEAKLTEQFCKASGYKAADVAAVNVSRGVVVTKNGGKYQVSSKGKVRHILGPEVPKNKPAAAEPEAEEAPAEKAAE